MKIIKALTRAGIFLAGLCLFSSPFIALWQTNRHAFEKVTGDSGIVAQYLNSAATPFFWFTTIIGIAVMCSAKWVAAEFGKFVADLVRRKTPKHNLRV